MEQDVRREQLTQWVHSLRDWERAVIDIASADASFRRYFRATVAHHSAIVMDAPPEKEDCRPFVDMTYRLLAADVHVPQLFAQNLLDGFLLLEDFGNQDYLSQLTPETADYLYQDAITSLLKLQTADTSHLPVYDTEWLLREMNSMPEWFLKVHLGLEESKIPTDLLQETFASIAQVAEQQPRVFVHRDYHSRNLMVTEARNLGVIDHQGAVFGPATYDLVSLLRDCYISWPQQRIEKWVHYYYKQAIALGVIPPVDEHSFLYWFDFMGMQRQIKVLGSFARLYHRDDKIHYLKDLPLTLSYLLTVGSKYPETSRLISWLYDSGIAQRIGARQLNG